MWFFTSALMVAWVIADQVSREGHMRTGHDGWKVKTF